MIPPAARIPPHRRSDKKANASESPGTAVRLKPRSSAERKLQVVPTAGRLTTAEMADEVAFPQRNANRRPDYPICHSARSRMSATAASLRTTAFLHRWRARSRKAAINPLRLISARGISIFCPLVAVTSSCSSSLRRRALSWRINSRTYSLGVPQSPEATCPPPIASRLLVVKY